MSLKNKVCLITGGTSGIGLALVKECIRQGAVVVTCSRNKDKLSALEASCKSTRLSTFRADVGIEADCKDLIAYTCKKAGRIDMLINNAGISMRALFQQLENLDILKRLMDINFWGTVYCTHYALPALLKTRGTVVGISSIAGYRGLPGRTGYSSSKFAMQGFLEALRTENLHNGLHVMWACPGFTASNIRNTALNEQGRAQAETPLEEQKLMSAEEVASRIIKGILQKRRTLIMTSQGKLTVLMNKLFPALTDKLVYNHFKKEPGSPLK